MKALINESGIVSNLDVIGSGSGGAVDPVLAEAAMSAVRQWEFTSTHLDGQPIEVSMKVHVTFRK